MNRLLACVLGGLLVAGPALAQRAAITTGPDGTLSGSVSVPGQAPMNIQAGGGEVRTDSGRSAAQAYPGDTRSLTVRSPDGRSSSSVSVSGDNAVVAGSGSPGSRVITHDDRRASTRVCPRGASRAYRLRTRCRLAHR